MTGRRRILCIVGTRPEAIKMAPVVQELRRRAFADTGLLATAQHRDLLDPMLRLFNLQPDADLDIMQPDQALPELSARLLTALDEHLSRLNPEVVLVQGDTTTVLMAALACFYRRIPLGHVEAGLRTGDLDYPFPEEMNRLLADRLAAFHFVPTPKGRENLLREGIEEGSIHVTGNTVIDALLQVAEKEIPLPVDLDPKKTLVLLTAHRREHFGPPLESVFRAVRDLVDRNPEVQVLYPVHPNPHVRAPAERILGGRDGIVLCDPLEYGPFVTAMKRCRFILSDSGGVQEEAPALAKPVLVLRNETERPEAVEAGVARLVGTERGTVLAAAEELLRNEAAYRAMARGASPFGDGHAAERIAAVLEGNKGRS